MASNPNKRPTFPRVSSIKDQDIKETIRLLWLEVHKFNTTQADHAAALAVAQSTISSQADTIDQINAQVVRLSPALGTSQALNPPGTQSGGEAGAGSSGGGAGGGSGGDSGGSTSDNGTGQTGCANSGSTGHLDPGFTVDPESAGRIVCGVGKEFPSLLAITVDQPTRDANRDELLNRMVWHLNLQGFPCSRYYTDNGYPWLLLFNVGSTQYAYRVIDYTADDYTQPITTTMVYGGQTPNTTTPPDGGTPD